MTLLRVTPFLRLGVAMVGLSLLAASAVAQTVDGQPEVKQAVIERVSQNLQERAFVPGIDFSKWPAFLEAEKPKLESAKNDEEFTAALNEALKKFGASHIYLMPPKTADVRRTGSMVGIGITQQAVPEGLLIVRVVPKGPAAEAGITPGDTIIEVDGMKPEGTKGIPGPEGTDVELKVKRANGKIKAFTLTRKKFSTIWPEELKEINGETAKLSVSTFEWTYNRENVEKLVDQSKKYRNLIIDLRDNPGGMVANVRHLLGLFLPEKAVVGTFVNKAMVDDYTKNSKTPSTDVAKIASWSKQQPKWESMQVHPFSNGTKYTGHIVVFVNAGSGSGAEIAAEALHEMVGASVVGQKSAGAVLVSTLNSASNNFMMMVPMMDYVSQAGVRLEGTGVVPELETAPIKIRLPDAPDESVDKALLLLNRTKLREERGLGTQSKQ